MSSIDSEIISYFDDILAGIMCHDEHFILLLYDEHYLASTAEYSVVCGVRRILTEVSV